MFFYDKIYIGGSMYFTYDNNEYKVNIIRKNNKNLYIRVSDNMTIDVTCPYLYTNKMIEKIISNNEKDIIKMIEKQNKRNSVKKEDNTSLLGSKIDIIYKDVNKPLFNENTLIVKDDIMLEKWYKKKAKEIFKIYLDEAYYVFDEKIPYPKLKVRSMKTRWGVCNRKDNSVTLNLDLIKKDQECLNYVIVHELSHFVHFDHSKEFWNTVEKYCPDYKRVRKELKY